jgi:hypothetical protein
MLDLLSKFDDITIENDTRIPKEDVIYCKEHERMYNEAYDMFFEFYTKALDWYNRNKDMQPTYTKYVDDYRSNSNSYSVLNDAILDINKAFINHIVNHFTDKYKVTIDTMEIHNKLIMDYIKGEERWDRDRYEYAIKKTNYNDILDQIFIQLGGFSFEDKAIKELKDKTRRTYQRHYSGSNMSIKGCKVSIDGYYSHKDSIWNEYRLSGNYDLIFTALYHYENGIIKEHTTELHNRYSGYDNEKRADRNYEKYEPYSLDKVKSIKFFKNGKLDIEFDGNQTAVFFAKEYLGYQDEA